MNKTERQLAIVLRLQSAGKNGLRAEDLAEFFETSKRTIYRDIQALSEAGVPLLAIPGQGYKVGEGYFLPPLTFTAHEALLLLLGCDFVADSFDEHYSRAAQEARVKIQAVLPPQLQSEVANWRAGFQLISQATDNPVNLKELRRATIESRVVQFEYYAKSSAEPIQRKANPYGLVFFAQTWYLVAYCHLRRSVRHFRLARIEKLILLNETFSRPPDFQLTSRQPPTNTTALTTVQVEFRPEVARWIKEDRFFFIVSKEQLSAGQTLVTLRVRNLADVLGWVLGWGKAAKVIEPPQLIELVQQELQASLAIYTKVEYD